jgi:hypothetical protein
MGDKGRNRRASHLEVAKGKLFSSLPRAPSDGGKALTAVIRETYIQGVSTRSVDDLIQAMGMSGISKSQVSRLCGEIDEKLQTFLNRPLEVDWPYIWLDATYEKVRKTGRIVSVAVIIAIQLAPGLPKLALFMDEAEEDVLAYMHFPRAHRSHHTPRGRDPAGAKR